MLVSPPVDSARKLDPIARAIAASTRPPTGGDRFAAFCSRYVRQTRGRWANSPLVLDTWELDFWREALEIDPATGLRVYQEAGLGVPTKNGKSTQASAAGLYFLTADGEAEPEVLVAAAAKPQARIVFGSARRMALASPLLLDHLRVLQHSLEAPRTGGIMRAVAADGLLQHGGSPSANIIDEVHAHKSGDLYTALTKSGAAREQPFTLWITTAGAGGEDSLLAELFGQMFTGAGELERRPGLLIYRDRQNGILIYWYGAERDDDIEDPAVWARVNPGLGTILEPRWLSGQFAKMKARNALADWRMYHLNVFVDAVEKAVDPSVLKAGTELDVVLDPGAPVGIGVYKTADGALASIVTAQRQPTDAGDRYVARAIHVPPDASGQAPSTVIRAHLTTLRDRYPRAMTVDPKTRIPKPGPAIAFMCYSLEESAAMLKAEGLNMVKFPLYGSTMGPASTLTSELIATRRLKHDGDVIMLEHVGRTDALRTDRGVQWVAAKDPDVNPSAIALVGALAMASQPAPTFRKSKPRTGVEF